MLQFKELTLADKATIQGYTLTSNRRNCDLSFANLCSWRFLYQTEFAEMDGYLILRFRLNEELSYMMPVGQGNLQPVILAMIADAESLGLPFVMRGVSVRMRADLEQTFPDKFQFESNRDYADYIYLRDHLATLRGKKFQAKRNHVNKFLRLYPDFTYYELTPELVPECLALEAQWTAETQQTNMAALESERRSMTYALQHFHELDLVGGVLCVAGKMAAFTYGTPINAFTFDVCVEKADTNIEGAYAMINYEFARRLPEHYQFINREEDLGIAGLRQAKLSYQPHEILEKHRVTLIANK